MKKKQYHIPSISSMEVEIISNLFDGSNNNVTPDGDVNIDEGSEVDDDPWGDAVTKQRNLWNESTGSAGGLW